jgi:hypothetical protein
MEEDLKTAKLVCGCRILLYSSVVEKSACSTVWAKAYTFSTKKHNIIISSRVPAVILGEVGFIINLLNSEMYYAAARREKAVIKYSRGSFFYEIYY